MSPVERRRRPAWHTGHWPMSTPVKRNRRVATGFVVSSAERLGSCGSRRWPRGEERPTPGQLRRAAPVGEPFDRLKTGSPKWRMRMTPSGRT